MHSRIKATAVGLTAVAAAPYILLKLLWLGGPTAAGVPRWAVWAAYLTSLTVLPSCIWRILGFTFDLPLVRIRKFFGTSAISAPTRAICGVRWRDGLARRTG